MNTNSRRDADYDFSRRSRIDPIFSQTQKPKSFIADNGGSFMGDLHNPLLENSIHAPARLDYRPKFTEYGLDDLMHPETIDKAKDWTEKITDFFKIAGDATNKVFSQLGDITNVGINKTASNPMIVTAGAAIVGLIAGLKAVKNILHGIKVAMDPKSDPKLGWLPHEILGILQGGLFFGLTSSFFGKRNFLTEFQNGKPVVKVKSIIGVGVAALGLSVAMALAKSTSVFRKVPLIGPAMQEISETVFGAAKEVTVPTEDNQNAAGHGAALPGMPG